MNLPVREDRWTVLAWLPLAMAILPAGDHRPFPATRKLGTPAGRPLPGRCKGEPNICPQRHVSLPPWLLGLIAYHLPKMLMPSDGEQRPCPEPQVLGRCVPPG